MSSGPDNTEGWEPRRILCVMRWSVGGIRTYILYHYRTLQEAGYRFTFVGPEDETFQQFADSFRGWEGVEFVAASLTKQSCQLRQVVRGLLRKRHFDLILSQGFTAGIQTVLGAFGTGVPHAITSHDVIWPGRYPGRIGRLKLRVIGHIMSRSDAVISLSEDAQANLQENIPSLRRSRCRTIPNGIDFQRLENADEGTGLVGSLRDRLGLEPDVYLMGFLGRFMEQKGFLPLVQALKLLASDGTARPFHLAAVGSGDYIREYRSEVQRTGMADRVTFLDVVPNPGPIIKELDLLVIPSLWEASPALPMETMALGVPVLGSDCIGLREVLRGTPSVMVPAGDVGALAAGLREAIANPRTAEARAYVPLARERFALPASAKRLREFLDELRGESRK